MSGEDRCYNAWGSANLNIPHFRRIFNWQAIYNISSREPLADAGLISYKEMKTGVEHVFSDSYSQTSEWKIFSLDGKLLHAGTGTPNVTTLSAGIYILIADTPQGRISKKIISTNGR